MSFCLTHEFDDTFVFKGEKFSVDMSFDNILRFLEMYSDEEFLFYEKVFIALKGLVDDYDKLELESFDEAYELFKAILREFLELDLDNTDKDGNSEVKTFDYQKDATLIYASFFSVYKMDLFEMQGKLHWKKFNALLIHLEDNSPLKQVIGYRTMTIPNGKHVDKEYRNHIIKMKQLYSLDDNATGKDSSYRSFEQLFNASNGK